MQQKALVLMKKDSIPPLTATNWIRNYQLPKDKKINPQEI